MEKHAKELLFDIETTNLKADMGIMLTFSYKWRGSKSKPNVMSIHEFPLFKEAPWDDSQLVLAAYDVLKEADSLIYHYGDEFDLPFFKTRLIKCGKYFPRTHTVDTCKVAWRHLKLSARLQNLAEFFELPELKMHISKEVWKRAGFGNIEALETLKERCRSDVDILDMVADKLAPYCKFINKNLFYKDKGCPNCGSKRIQSNGRKYYATDATLRRHYECQECWTVFRGEVISNSGNYRPL